MRKRGILAVLIALSGCVEYRSGVPPIVLNVTSENEECRVSVTTNPYQTPIAFTRVHQDQLLQIGRGLRGRRAVVIYDRKTQYKCLGAAIITLQQAGLVVDPVPWDN